ncbi:hypothetical protein Goklo_021588 [Gossypium klotzschianum]|uniref:Uncharacterized protein n=1 Tax=Gossypium klotzschianum TaxID=34286 RepID=A0A7J8UWD5_9ROSI|nr:hypothetical protein [Gossypium klotzschianum]
MVLFQFRNLIGSDIFVENATNVVKLVAFLVFDPCTSGNHFEVLSFLFIVVKVLYYFHFFYLTSSFGVGLGF